MAILAQLIKRVDGSEVKIVAQAFGLGFPGSIGIHVLRRQSSGHAWKLTNDRPHPGWRTMSVDDYVKYGRSEMLRTVSIGEILKASSQLRAQLVL